MNTNSEPRLSYRNFSLWIAAAVCLGGLACFRNLDETKVKCISNATCPTGHS